MNQNYKFKSGKEKLNLHMYLIGDKPLFPSINLYLFNMFVHC